jgi:hyperosmotically inducible protein
MRHWRELTLMVCLFCVAEAAAAQAAPAPGSDIALAAKVKAALASDRAVQSRDIEVESRGGVVQLSGFVDTESVRDAALLRARSVEGVAEVRNDLSVRTGDRPAAAPIADRVIAARVRDSLGNVKLADESDVNVEVSEGVVQLSGFVKTVEEKTQAGDAASAVAGVRDVENHIALLDESKRRRPE